MPQTITLERGTARLAVRAHGSPRAGTPSLVLIHGYPDNQRIWDGVIEALPTSWHCVSYDVRGSGESSAPRHSREYTLAALMADLEQILDKASPTGPVHLVGHDWGAIQGWEAVSDARIGPRIASLTALCGPCLDQVGAQLRRDLRQSAGRRRVARQLLHSWYVGAMHLPGLAAGAWRLGLDRAWPRLLYRLDGVTEAHSVQRRAQGIHGIGLYRANVRQRLLRPAPRSIPQPVQLITAKRDPFATEALFTDVERWVPQLQRTRIDAGHWLPLSHPRWVAEQIGHFVASCEKNAKPPAAP